jgi:CRP/FNR family transcriptional regulator, cyclic AMP receptor protein
MPSLIPDFATLERRLAGLSVVKHRAQEVVLTAGSKTGGLLFLRSGTVEVVKDGVQVASVNAPGSVFGEQAVLLDQPHMADVRTLEQSEFYVANFGDASLKKILKLLPQLTSADCDALRRELNVPR